MCTLDDVRSPMRGLRPGLSVPQLLAVFAMMNTYPIILPYWVHWVVTTMLFQGSARMENFHASRLGDLDAEDKGCSLCGQSRPLAKVQDMRCRKN